MGQFDELLGQLRNPGEDGIPEELFDQLAHTYQHDVSTREAKITQLSTAHENDQKEILGLKSLNFDLMQAQPDTSGSGQNPNLDNDGQRPRGIAGLFG
jgi:hypothetical protein